MAEVTIKRHMVWFEGMLEHVCLWTFEFEKIAITSQQLYSPQSSIVLIMHDIRLLDTHFTFATNAINQHQIEINTTTTVPKQKEHSIFLHETRPTKKKNAISFWLWAHATRSRSRHMNDKTRGVHGGHVTVNNMLTASVGQLASWALIAVSAIASKCEIVSEYIHSISPYSTAASIVVSYVCDNVTVYSSSNNNNMQKWFIGRKWRKKKGTVNDMFDGRLWWFDSNLGQEWNVICVYTKDML